MILTCITSIPYRCPIDSLYLLCICHPSGICMPLGWQLEHSQTRSYKLHSKAGSWQMLLLLDNSFGIWPVSNTFRQEINFFWHLFLPIGGNAKSSSRHVYGGRDPHLYNRCLRHLNICVLMLICRYQVYCTHFQDWKAEFKMPGEVPTSASVEIADALDSNCLDPPVGRSHCRKR